MPDVSTAPQTPASRMPAYFFAHGAGPCFFMDWPYGAPDTWDRLGQWLRALGPEAQALAGRPQAIVVVSAHWEAAPLRVNGLHRNGLLFDYGGFPPHTYELSYPAPGSAPWADRVAGLLGKGGFDVHHDDDRGLDHGVFIPLLLAHPDADIPVVQLSLHPSLDPAYHLAVGQALAPLRDEGVLLLGSGMSYHNRPGFGPDAQQLARAFDAWLTDAVCARTGDERAAQLARWAQAPGARQAHPREEHLLPLMVMAGAAGHEPAHATFAEPIGGIPVSCYRFGG